MDNNKLYCIYYLEADLKLVSPLALGNGEGRHADQDVFLNLDGQAVIPGTSIAGVTYHYFSDVVRYSPQKYPAGEQERINQLWGHANGEDQTAISSMILFYDAVSSKKAEPWLMIRDQVAVEEGTGTAADMGKRDLEAVSPSDENLLSFRIEVQIREKYKELTEFAGTILKNIVLLGMEGKLRFGGKTSRGYGKVVLSRPRWKKLTFYNKDAKAGAEENVEAVRYAAQEYIRFRWKEDQLEAMTELADCMRYCVDDWELRLPLRLDRTLNIRSYDTSTWDVDSKSMTVDRGRKDRAEEQPFTVIPGTSWAGAFRHHIKEILKQIYWETGGKTLSPAEMETVLLIPLFGTKKDRGKDEKTGSAQGFRSRIIFEESEDEELVSKFADVSRIRIDRFTGGVASGGLLTERVALDGRFWLHVIVRNARDYEKALVYLAAEDLMSGGLAIGGETGIGRGIFRLDEERIKKSGETLPDPTPWYQALTSVLKKWEDTDEEGTEGHSRR